MTKLKMLLLISCLLGLAGCASETSTETDESVTDQQYTQIGETSIVNGQYFRTVLDNDSGVEYIMITSPHGVSITPRLQTQP